MKRNDKKIAVPIVRRPLFAAAVLGMGLLLGGQALAVDPDGYNPALAPSNPIGFDIEGCNLNKATEGTYDATAMPPILTCDNDAYTDGNLGKEWNELDLVPHRIESETFGLTTADETYHVIVGADNQTDDDPLKIGFDRVVNFVFNDALSSGDATDCQLTLIGGNQIGDFGIGGADLQVVQVLQITQTAETTCVWDYVERLAITSSLISGSSTRSFIFAGTGAQSVPIPSDIQPQVLDKSMSAVEDSLIKWTIAKIANPVDWNFGNTCNAGVPNTKDVTVDITFTKGATEFGDLTATTTVDATNPSSRIVYYDCKDVVYSVDTPVDTQEPDPFGVPAGEMVMFDIEHILAPGTRDLRDELTCTLQVEDILDPGTFIDVGTLMAEFSLPNDDIGAGAVVNETVVVEDTESITEGALRYDFSAVQSGGVTGAFIGYTPGSLTDGPVVWNSESQGDSGTVQFTKTVTVERGYDINGKLEDTASIDLTDTTDVSASAATTFSTDPKIDLVINKSLGFAVANATTWTFEVKDSDGNVETNPQITIAGLSTSGSVTVHDLDPDTYTVTETVVNGWVPTANPQNVTLSLPSCEGSVTFTNNPAADFFAEVEVKKMTDPTGSEAGWQFDLTGSAGGESASVTTTDSNFIRFNLSGGANLGADPGSYSMAEVLQTGWDLETDIVFAKVGCIDSAQNVAAETRTSCDFGVQYDRDAGCVFQCAYENIQRGKIIVEKQTDPADSPQEFVFVGAAAGQIADNGQIMVDNLVPGTYTSEEIVPAEWDLTSIQCDDGASLTPSSGDIVTATATFELDPGETVTCVFTNVERGMADVLKTVSGQLPGGFTFDFEIRTDADASSEGTVAASCTTDAVTGACMFTCVAGDPPCRDVNGAAKLVPGDYQFCEANVMPGWMSNIKGFADAFPLPINGSFFIPNQNDPLVDNSVYCAPFELVAGATETFRVDNSPPPGGDARTIGFWKNWSSCTGGNQDAVLDETLANSLLGGIWIGEVFVVNCEDAVRILDKRDNSGKKKASDPCFNAASQLLASQLNEEAGARTCAALVELQAETQAELVDLEFAGDACRLNKRKDGDSITLLNTNAGELDDYNNNELGSVCN